jgi:hopene-associated glycosyltransferase HpnB
MLIFLSLCALLASASFLAWLYIFFQPARPWDFWPVGDAEPVPAESLDSWPAVRVLVPARNEAESLPQTLPALLNQDYPGDFKVTLIDDRSTDGTADIARKIATDLRRDDRLQVLTGAPLPESWVGKMWALEQGVRAALTTNQSGEGEIARAADYVLLTDADILHAAGSLRRLVLESRAAKLGLNSRMALLRCVSRAEKLLIPAFVFFFNLLYPMRRVNNPRDPLAAAAGGCVLLSSEALEKIGGGLSCIRNEIIDDVNLGRQVKKTGLPIRLSLSAREVVSLRDYPVLADIWKMVTRTAFTELKYSWLRLTGAMLGLSFIFIVPILATLGGAIGLLLNHEPAYHLPLLAILAHGVMALVWMRIVYTPATLFFKLPTRYAWTLPLAGILYGLMTLDSALRHARGLGPGWRDVKPPANTSAA